MRCKKCGFISFDWLTTCKKCGKSLDEERELIGIFFADDKKIDWFHIENGGKEFKENGASPVDLAKIDVSDLVEEELQEHDVEIKEDELAQIAKDEDFQKALEEIAK